MHYQLGQNDCEKKPLLCVTMQIALATTAGIGAVSNSIRNA